MLDLADFTLQEQPEDNLMAAISGVWYNGSYTMATDECNLQQRQPEQQTGSSLRDQMLQLPGHISWVILAEV